MTRKEILDKLTPLRGPKMKRINNYMPPTSAEDLVLRYRRGERHFPRTTVSDCCIEESMPGIDLTESSLRVVFSDVDLRGACFRGADLCFCHFDANLSGANLEDAEMVWANFGWSNFTGANLQGTNLRHAEAKFDVVKVIDQPDLGFKTEMLLGVNGHTYLKIADHHSPEYGRFYRVIEELGKSPE